jgi:hypothetical protein
MLRRMKNANLRSSAAAVATAALLLLPSAAFAREGAASGGNKTTPTFAAECGVITATNSPQLFKTSGGGMSLDVNVTNCGPYIGSYDIDERGTATGVSPLDPLTTLACTTPTATAGHLTVKAGGSDTARLAPLPAYCATGIWGTNGTYDVVYDITLKDAASGTPLGTTQSVIQYRSVVGA